MLFLTMNAGIASQPAVIEGARLIAVYAIGLVPMLLCWDWLGGERPQRETALQATATIIIALGINQLIGLFIFVPRPFAIPLGHTFLASATDTSFPSDHATVLLSALVAYAGARRWPAALSLFVIALAICWARIYLGVHMPLDMLGALATSLLAALAAKVFMDLAGDFLVSLGEAIYRVLFAPFIRMGWVRR